MAQGKNKLLCPTEVKPFVLDGKTYVFNKQDDGGFLYKELKFNIRIKDEDGDDGNCGLVDPDTLFCDTSFGDFTFQGREWGFQRRRNGIIEHVPY